MTARRIIRCARCQQRARHLVDAGTRSEVVCDACLPASHRWASAAGPVVVTDLDQLTLFDPPTPVGNQRKQSRHGKQGAPAGRLPHRGRHIPHPPRKER